MANKEITINKDRIVVKKLIGSNLETVFSTDNLYLKTDPSGVLKAGGYERCPVVVGYGSIIDDTRYGGFPVFDSSITGGAWSTDISIFCPSLVDFSVVGVVPPYPVPYINADSPVLNIKDPNGANLGTFKWHLDGRGVPQEYWGQYPPGPFARSVYLKEISLSALSSNDIYIFPYYSPATGQQWTNLNNNAQYTLSYPNAFSLGMTIFVTRPTSSLSLAVTL